MSPSPFSFWSGTATQAVLDDGNGELRDINADPIAVELLGGVNRRAAAAERVEHLFYFRPRVELNQLVPKNCAVILTKLFNEPGCETIDDLAVFDLEFLVAFFRFVTERFNDCGVKIFVTRNKPPKTLTTLFQVITLVLGVLFAIATTVDGDDVFG